MLIKIAGQVNANERLFTSANPATPASYAPIMDNPCATPADDTTAKGLCGTSFSCYYDYCVTHDSGLARATLASETAYNATRRILSEFVSNCLINYFLV